MYMFVFSNATKKNNEQKINKYVNQLTADEEEDL